jgi:predicted O-linked N-acetylglucosamine transferase (SPINDLY family)
MPEVVDRIRQAACDLIYYWEVGSDAMNYLLPFARLAPVQCTGWDSTITSGVPAVDYFLSSELIESPGSEVQYTERLWRSKTLFANTGRLPAVSPASPGHFGLPDDRRVYLCFQNPLKLHPDMDPLLAAILAADPRGLIVLYGRQPEVVRLLKERFARRIPQSAERILFLSPQSFENYCRLLQLADVILDTVHYGAGSSCYDLFSFNLPVVTWPGELIVGRMTQACYRKMAVDDLIVHSAEDYVSKAVQVANDGDYRKYVTKRIAQASDVLFDDLEAVREHERFFEEVISAPEHR